MSKTQNPPAPESTLSPQAAATAEYLRSIGLDPTAAMAAPPRLESLKPERAEGPVFVGAVDPDLEYFRATRKNPVELRGLIDNEGYTVVPDGVRYDGCSDENDVILARRKDVRVALERRRLAQRTARRRGAVQPQRREGYQTTSATATRHVRMPADFDQAPTDLT